MRKAKLLELWESAQLEEPRKIYFSRELKKKKKSFIDLLKERSTASLERLKKRVHILKSSVKDVLPFNVSNVIEESTNKAMEFVEKAWSFKDQLKEKARTRLLELNRKIGKLLEKPGLAGKKFIVSAKDGYSTKGFLKNLRKSLIDIMKKNFGTKVKIVLHCLMRSTDLKTGKEFEDVGFFSSLVEEVFEGSDLNELLDLMFERILENMANFQKGKSNWRFVRVEKLEIQFDEMSHVDGVGEWMPLPELLEKKHALVNPKNNDEECFKWCVTRAFFPKKFIRNELVI